MKTKQLTIICVFLIICMFVSEDNFKYKQNFDILTHSTFDSTLPPRRLSIPQLEAYDASHDILKVQEQSPHVSPLKNEKSKSGNALIVDNGSDFDRTPGSRSLFIVDGPTGDATIYINNILNMRGTEKVTICGYGKCIDIENPEDWGKDAFTP